MRLSHMVMVLIAIVAIFVNCSIESPTQTSGGGGIETIANGTIIGSDGEVAPNTQVILFLDTFNPVEDVIPDSMIDTTDAQGRFAFTITDSFTYNIAAVQLVKRTRLLMIDVKASRDTIFFVDTLREPGVINVELPDDADTVLGYVFIQGTNIYRKLLGNVVEGNRVIVDSVPAATISDICYYEKDDPDTLKMLADTLTVLSGDTSYTQIFGLIKVYNTWNSGLTNNRVCALERDNSGNIWMGTYRGGLVKFDGTDWIIYNKNNSDLPNNYVYSLALDTDGSIWAGTMKGLVHFDGVNWAVYDKTNSGLVSDSVYVITIETNRTLWIGSDNGLTSFTGTDWRHFNTQNSGLPNDVVYSVAIDKYGDKWIGTHSGIAHYNGSQWIVYDESNSGLPDNIVMTIVLDNNDGKWIGTYYGGLARYDGSLWITYDDNYLQDNGVRTIAIDINNIMWIGTEGCGNVVKYDNNKWEVYDNSALDMPYTFERVNDIIFNGDGKILVATQLDGVLVLGKRARRFAY